MSLLDDLRIAHNGAAPNPSRQKIFAEFVASQEALEQQRQEADVVRVMANPSALKTALKTRGIQDSQITDITAGFKIIQAELGRLKQEAATAKGKVETKQQEIDAESVKIAEAARKLQNLQDKIKANTAKLKAAQESVSKLQAATITAAKSTAADAPFKTTVVVCELEEALTLLASDPDDPSLITLIGDQIDAQLTAQSMIEKKKKEKTRLEEDAKRAEDQLRKAEQQRAQQIDELIDRVRNLAVPVP